MIQAGLLNFHFYGLIIGLGILAGYKVSQKRLSDFKLGIESFDKVFFFMILFGLIGARLYHVLDYWSYYQSNLVAVFLLWRGGLATYGAIFGAIFGLALFLLKQNRLRLFLSWTDVIAPGALLAQAIGRWGNFFNQEAFGLPTNLPWSIYIAPQNRPTQYQSFSSFHPVFFYESIWNLVGFILLSKYFTKPKAKGTPTGFYLLWYGVGRFFLEFLRFDTAIISGVKVAQITSILAIIIGSLLLYHRRQGVTSVKSN